MNMEYLKALEIAERIKAVLAPFSERIEIAGSIRREKPEVKDIELVCLPKKETLKDLFGWDEGSIVDFGFSTNVDNLGKIIKGNSDGRYMQIELEEGIMLDLFMPIKQDYFRQLAIRTGSADYSFKVIATAWKNQGYCGTPDGLRLMMECLETKTPEGKSKWKCVVQKPTMPPIWESEEHFFSWLQIKWIEPKYRIV